MGHPGDETDLALEALIPLAERACRLRTTCVGLGLWIDNPFTGFLPFHLHLRWPGRIVELPVNATFAVVPRLDPEVAAARIYRVSECLSALRRARAARGVARQARAGDLSPPDWAQGWSKRTDEPTDDILAGNSFVAIDSVNGDTGRISRGSRSVLGRHAARTAPRPCILVPGPGAPTAAALARFAAADFALIDVRGVRGNRALDWVLGVLRARRERAPSILVASGPGDLLAPGMAEALRSCSFTAIGEPPPTPTIVVTIVGEDRPTLERAFQMAVEQQTSTSLTTDHLLKLATTAWWSERQALTSDGAPQPETERFFTALGAAALETPDAAAAVQTAAGLLRDSSRMSAAGHARLDAAVTAALTGNGTGDVLLLTRNWHSTTAARHAIATALQIQPGEIEALGLTVQTFRHRHLRTAPSIVVLAGYFGRDSLEAALRARPRRLHFVLDPIEARALLFGLRDTLGIMHHAGITTAHGLLNAISDAVRPHAPAFADDAELELGVNVGVHSVEAAASVRVSPAPGSVLVALTDGTNLLVPGSARFDVMARFGGSFRTCSANRLQPGDEVIVLMEDAQRQFSDALLDVLDRGALAPLVQQRATWLAIVSSVMEARRTSVATLTERLRADGHTLDVASVRAWTRFQRSEDAAVPRHRAVFIALARALEIQLPEAQLHDLFDSIRRLRTLHRKAGRDLVRAIRLARGGRLGAVSQAQAERQWGLDTTDLMNAGRIGIVDEIVVG